MRGIDWVFGASAVGKRTFISNLSLPPRLGIRSPYYVYGLGEGPLPSSETLHYMALLHPLLIRWQWGREETLRTLATPPACAQHIYYLTAPLPVRLAWMRKREGFDKWSEDNLRGEAENVEKLVRELSDTYGIVVTKV